MQNGSRPEMALSYLGKRWPSSFSASLLLRSFRSDAALEALAKASEAKMPNLVLYNYPSFSGAFSALFAHLYHSHLNLPYLILPFSSVAPFRAQNMLLSRFSGTKRICPGAFKKNIMQGHTTRMLNPKDGERVETVLKYIEDGDLRRWSLPDSKAFNIGILKWRSKLNCIINPHMYEQLMEMSSINLIAGGNCYMSTRQTAANKFLTNVFKVRLGRGFYGECLGVKIDGNSDLVDEIGKELSKKSAAAGLRPIGAVVYMQRKNLKMCLRSIDCCTDTSEVAKAYGGGGSLSSSSFMIRMDEYHKWISLF